MAKIWKINEIMPVDFITASEEHNPVLLQLLYNRGFKTKEAVTNFFASGDQEFDPLLFKDMAPALDLIISHIKAGHKIMVYGDYDADGVTASIVLAETLELFKAQTDIYLPDRVTEGYGLNREALEKIIADGFKLVITVDNGIRNKPEVEYLKSQNIDVIITDHHAWPENEAAVPPALIINPANPHDDYPEKKLAGVGVAFKLVSALVERAKLAPGDKQKLLNRVLDLVAIGTVADLVPLLGENRCLVKKGLAILNNTKRIGLQALIQTAKLGNNDNLDTWNIAFQLAPRLNAASRLGHASNALALLTCQDKTEALKLADELSQKNSERQQITDKITKQVIDSIDEKNLPKIIFGIPQSDEAWNEGVIGLVAGKISEKYYRPCLIITKTEDGWKGSGRSIEEFNLISALEDCKESLDKYGGHPRACGFSLLGEDNLKKFLAQMTELAEKELAGKELQAKLKIDAEIKTVDINLLLVEDILKLAPFGQANPQPKFVSFKVPLTSILPIGSDAKHLKLRLGNFWALAFGRAEELSYLKINDLVDVVYSLEINGYNGQREVQLKIIDIKKSE